MSTRTEEEMQLINSVLGESYNDYQSYKDVQKAAQIKATRGALIKVLREFDEYCDKNTILYFVIAKTLSGVVAYGDFLPEANTVEIAMTRDNYRRFQTVYSSDLAARGKAPYSFWSLNENYVLNNKIIPRPLPRLQVNENMVVTLNGEELYGSTSMPMTVRPFIEISILDEVPDDFLMRKKFFRQMRRRNKIFNYTLKARQYLLNRANDDLIDENAQIVSNFSVFNTLLQAFIPLTFSSRLVWGLSSRYNGTGQGQYCRVMGDHRSKLIPREDIGQCPKRPFAGIMVRCPEKADIWQLPPVMETTPEIKRLQDDAKEIVVEIDRVCQVLGIEYFACGGTMLGYVRHGGFIPWDDDIDVGMLRADYERFKAEAGKVIDSDRFFLQTRESDPSIPYLFSKVRMNNTSYITEYNKDRDFHKGICVDVFPFDYIPNDFHAQSVFRQEVRNVEKRHNRIVNRQYTESMTETTVAKKNLDWLTAQITGRLMIKYYTSKSLASTQQAYEDICTRLDDKSEELNLKYVACFVPSYTMVRVKDLKPYQRVEFDGIMVNIPRNPEIFLHMQYGDFMIMPYPHQRAGHDLLVWSDNEGIGGGRLADELNEDD